MTLTEFMELLEKLGIDWRILLGQIVNFCILLFLLSKFIYKPVLAILDKRSKKIEKSLEDAKTIEKNVKETTQQAQEIILNARKEGESIISSAKMISEKERNELLEKTKREIHALFEKEKKQIAVAKEEMMKTVKDELADLVVFASTHYLDKTIQKDVDKKLIEKVLKSL